MSAAPAMTGTSANRHTASAVLFKVRYHAINDFGGPSDGETAL
ncbi:hypothetical protein LMG28614_07140 [Paraburkholderia ultramafica]|uniref:Uncharacterized protein n=1 Tax=Paraburkholderia ultramafica TaxID=1544867 RepID=A0A6S7CIC0_9BURK|nr:hypothetical protein LMG28614_07140 [Paraburkholderia ultramafica]